MSIGCFYEKESNCVVKDEVLENELPEVFMVDAMKNNTFPKLSYITMLGKIACAASSYVDREILNIILNDDDVYDNAVEFLCNRYTFRKYVQFNLDVTCDLGADLGV